MDDNEASRVRALGEILAEFDLDSLRVKVGDAEYELIRREPQSSLPVANAPAPAANFNGAAASADGLGAGRGGLAVPDRALRVIAPVVGVFYRSASPGSEPFVSVGDRVAVGQPLCILEAMKLMNEITSDFAGIVTRILPENGELVRLNEELFWIEP
jgi:acetyl-CoA carboxylase biotin carboxyl carrier protein